ncbi:hypothetical protein Leryth_024659 [Lithospermum erythrorhizon]|nr:hypothetical protein Leryth_024659 [Lithospermum erythrorhizon]
MVQTLQTKRTKDINTEYLAWQLVGRNIGKYEVVSRVNDSEDLRPKTQSGVIKFRKVNMLSRARGELGLRVFITDDPSVNAAPRLPSLDTSSHISSLSSLAEAATQDIPESVKDINSNGKASLKHTFRNVPKSNHQPQQSQYSNGQQPVKYAVDQMRSEPQGVTRHFDKVQNPEWNAVFAFAKDQLQSSVLDVLVKDKDLIKDDFVGILRFDLRDVPTRVPPDSPLAPEWYRLEDKKGEKKKGELMLAVWMGSQADEAFPDAWHSDAFSEVDGSVPISHFRSKVYHSPRLWYVRVNVIEAQDIIPSEKSRFLNVYVRRADKEKKEINKDKFASRLHLRVCLDGGYHVLDESTHYSSDLRPTAKQLWKSPVGILELGILNANGLQPMKSRDGKGTSDSYCVAKYGHKWVRTRTIVDSQNPKYNEQYTWEVFDPATVLTVGVFDNGHIGSSSNGNRDTKIGKVRIRISTLETGRVYTHTYPLLILHPSGVKKMGELHLAIRFSCTSMYSKPLLPKMHYARPLSIGQLDMLRYQAVNTVASRLSRAEPPLRKEVVEYMTDADSHLWSMRRSKSNFFRLMSLFTGLVAVTKWFGEVCKWKNPITTVLVHVLFVMLVCFPELILPTVFLYMFLIGLWNYRYRPRYPPHMDARISYAEAVHPDELDEEFDTFPTTRSPDLVRMRYDRLRTVAGKIQAVVGDIATQGERFQALLSWRDPRATALFLTFCLIAAMVLYATPLQVLAALGGFYVMRHPKFRHKLPSPPLNFFRRLPARTDSML